MSSYVVIMMVRRNDNDDTYVCNTTRNGDGCQLGARLKGIFTLR